MSRRQQIEILLRNTEQVYQDDYTQSDLSVNPDFDMNTHAQQQPEHDSQIQPQPQPQTTHHSNPQQSQTRSHTEVNLIQQLQTNGIDLIKAQQVKKLLDSLSSDQRKALSTAISNYV